MSEREHGRVRVYQEMRPTKSGIRRDLLEFRTLDRQSMSAHIQRGAEDVFDDVACEDFHLHRGLDASACGLWSDTHHAREKIYLSQKPVGQSWSP